ncbi:ASCH domain-containing protein [Desulfurococcus mucosus]|uniref:ASCH domain-containing protein n=1 Tax=Desulfurococcus mucosus TaxID=2275 RepID=UPI00064F846C|nr:ASCH domain-containing protein [Desulfurococcus mucosus]
MPRARFIGRHIMLKGWYAGKLLSGEKKATIRLGIVKPRYEEVIVHAGGKPIAKARIRRVYYRRMRDLTDEEARLEGFKNRDELVEELRRLYGDISGDQYLTVLELEVVQRLDELDPGHPYAGMRPADIARLALRYLAGALSSEELEVLRDLTRTDSIRRTAVNLYGSVEKRGIVRRTLRKALKLLAESKLISLGHRQEASEEPSDSQR